MTIHPEFCDLVLFNTTPATTPSPNRINSPVPIASAVKLFMTTPFSRRQGKQPGPPRPWRELPGPPPFSRQTIMGGAFHKSQDRSVSYVKSVQFKTAFGIVERDA